MENGNLFLIVLPKLLYKIVGVFSLEKKQRFILSANNYSVELLRNAKIFSQTLLSLTGRKANPNMKQV